jgi:hypothetical protein
VRDLWRGARTTLAALALAHVAQYGYPYDKINNAF